MKKLLSVFLTALLLVNALGVTALAGSFDASGNWVSNSPADLPAGTGDTVYDGPEAVSSCDTPAHTHSNNCYPVTCGGLDIFHWWHNDSCYDRTAATCGLTEHQHSALTCPTVYTWTPVTKAQAQWREWWPVYWGYDVNSEVTDLSVVSGVTAGGVAVKFTSTGVDASTAITDATASSGDTLRGVTVTVQPGYYISSYRFVCGNHTGCHTTGHSERTHIPSVDGSYTSSLTFYPSTKDYDHWNAGDISTNTNSTYYMPWEKPTGSNIYYTFDRGSNLNYPFYLLFEVHEDTTSYNLTYEWGEAALTAALPAGVTGMARNASHTVLAPSAEAVSEALGKGYAFAGWKVVGSGYDADATVQAGNTVTNYGSDITLVAQWTEKNTVIYSYTGEVPAGAPAAPAAAEYHVGDIVTVAQAPTFAGYTFSGWSTQDLTPSSPASFTMPDAPVHFTGSWTKDSTQTKPVSYTVKYLFNEQPDANYPDATVSGSVWVKDEAVLPWDASKILTVSGWAFVGSTPAAIPAMVADGSVITLHYAGTNAEVSIVKTVEQKDGSSINEVEVGDVLTYTVTVTNTGNADTGALVLLDEQSGAGTVTFGGQTGITFTADFNDPTYGNVDKFEVANVSKNGGTVTFRYDYTVAPEDAGKTLTNFVHCVYNNEYVGDTETVEVEETFKLTTEVYLDGTLDAGRTAETTMKKDSPWSVTPPVVAGYAFDPLVSTDPLSGTLTADTTVRLYYWTDANGDTIPDKYQMTVLYVSENTAAGTITGITSEIVTVYRTEALVPFDYAEEGYARASGSVVTVNTGYTFKHWDVTVPGHPVAHLDYPADMRGQTIVQGNARGGMTVTFTARFDTKDLEIKKNVSEATAAPGDVLHFEIHLHNMGTVTLTNVTVTDVLGYADGSAFAGTIVFDAADEDHAAAGITYEPLTGTFTVPSIEPGHFVNIIYTYEVQLADENKTLKNTATASYGGADTPSASAESVVSTLPRYTVTYQDGVSGAVFADDVHRDLLPGTATPAFRGTPSRTGFYFMGWSPAVSATVTESVTYVAQWLPQPPVVTTGTLSLTKIEAGNPAVTLAGVEFQLYSESGIALGTYTTNADGKILATLNTGSYYLAETKTADGYELDQTPVSFVVTAGRTTSLTVENVKTAVPGVFTGDHYAYIIGRDDGLVHPEANITRAEAATIFFRLLSDPVRSAFLTENNAYTDVSEADWFNAAVSTLTAMQVLQGHDGFYRPNDFITRAEFAAIAARFDTNGNGSDASFEDIYGHWGQKEINIAANNGWVLGYEDGTFQPDQYITRAEAVTIVNRVLQRVPESPADLLPGMVEWPDNQDTTAWYYLAIQEATNSHDYARKQNGYESWTALRPVRDWTVYEK